MSLTFVTPFFLASYLIFCSKEKSADFYNAKSKFICRACSISARRILGLSFFLEHLSIKKNPEKFCIIIGTENRRHQCKEVYEIISNLKS